MTKLRPPLSIDAALARIAGLLDRGWEQMAEVTGRKIGMIRAWADPQRRERIPVEDAIALDLAYRRAGGEGAPIFECYGAQLDAAGVEWFSSQIALGHEVTRLIKECSEAETATLLASMPGSTARDRTHALREVDQAIAELQRTKIMLSGVPGAPFPDEHPSTGPPPATLPGGA